MTTPASAPARDPVDADGADLVPGWLRRLAEGATAGASPPAPPAATAAPAPG